MSQLRNRTNTIFYQSTRLISNQSAGVTKIRRAVFPKKYPVVLVEPDGSTYTIRHFEPRKIITLPIDVSKLSPEELEIHLQSRKVLKKIVIEEEEALDFQKEDYLKFLNRK